MKIIKLLLFVFIFGTLITSCCNVKQEQRYIDANKYGMCPGYVTGHPQGYMDGTVKVNVEDINGKVHKFWIGKFKYKNVGELRYGDSLTDGPYTPNNKEINSTEVEFEDSFKNF